MFDRIILGTANFSKEYDGHKVSDIDSILTYCKEIGVYALDTAMDYNTAHLDYPRKIVKLQRGDVFLKSPTENKPLCFMAHNSEAYSHAIEQCQKWHVPLGLSIYDQDCLNAISDKEIAPHVIQLPYSIFDRRMEKIFPFLKANGVEIHARSVFLRGKVLEKFDPFKALSFVLMNPMIDRVVIGTQSLQMLQDTLEPFREIQNAEVTDIEILDPRRWK
jgi:aryl-alcohol dehydrogenase-like predicted oxidoreductase